MAAVSDFFFDFLFETSSADMQDVSLLHAGREQLFYRQYLMCIRLFSQQAHMLHSAVYSSTSLYSPISPLETAALGCKLALQCTILASLGGS